MAAREDRRSAEAPPTVRLSTPGARPPVRTRALELAVTDGPDRGRTFQLKGAQCRIGTGPENDVVLTDHAVSRAHVAIEQVSDGYVVRDLSSTNGTRINGVRTQEAHVTADSSINLGSTTLRMILRAADLVVQTHESERFAGLIGKSLPMRELFGYLDRVSPTDLPILLLGETGTGKELIARAIHETSRRKAGPCVVFDCGACDPALVTAALFGHTHGAFTGASGARKGAFASAHQGTLFIDEIGDLPLDIQPKLLRALQTGEIQPLGADQVTRVDVRVVSATHRHLETMVNEGKFREDLFFRLAGLALEIPALRDRPGDVSLLASIFCSAAAPPRELGDTAIQALESYAWPGNVRELKNVLDRAIALHTSNTLEAEHLILGRARVVPSRTGEALSRPGPEASRLGLTPPPSEPVPQTTLEQAEKQAILGALNAAGGNKSKAARMLGISRQTLHDKLARYGNSGS